MPRTKLDLPRVKVQVVLHLDDEAQHYAFERLEELRKQGKMQEYLRDIITKSFPKVSENNRKVIHTESPTKKPVENLPIESSVDKPAKPMVQKTPEVPVSSSWQGRPHPKPGG